MGLLSGIQTDRPGLIQNLNSEAVAWWEASASRPRIGMAAFLAFLILPLAALLAVAPEGASSLWPFALVGSAALCAVYFFGVVRPRIAWRAGQRERAPRWRRYGWAIVGLLLPTLGAVAVVSDIDPTWGVLLLLMISMAAAGWARVTGEPAFPVATENRLALIGLLRTGKGLQRFSYLAIFWIVISMNVQNDRWLLMVAAGLGSILVFLTGGGSLQHAVEKVGKDARSIYYLPGMVSLGLSAGLAVFAATSEALLPWLASLAGAVGLLEVTLDRVLTEDQRVRRAWLAGPIWLGAWLVNTVIDAGTTSAVGAFSVWMLLLSALTLWQASRRDSGKSHKANL